MSTHGFALFDTSIGRCGIVWSPCGIAGVQLPEPRVAATRARVLKRFPGAVPQSPPPDVQRAIDGIVALLRGETSDLSAVKLDLLGIADFDRSVYEVARTIAQASTLTYGEVAVRIGAPGSARAVGQALGRNPFPIIVPCHRVLAAGGRTGGFSASGGAETKLRLLAIEGACPNGTLPLPFG